MNLLLFYARITKAKALDDIDNTFRWIESKAQCPVVAFRACQCQTRTEFVTEIEIV